MVNGRGRRGEAWWEWQVEQDIRLDKGVGGSEYDVRGPLRADDSDRPASNHCYIRAGSGNANTGSLALTEQLSQKIYQVLPVCCVMGEGRCAGILTQTGMRVCKRNESAHYSFLALRTAAPAAHPHGGRCSLLTAQRSAFCEAETQRSIATRKRC